MYPIFTIPLFFEENVMCVANLINSFLLVLLIYYTLPTPTHQAIELIQLIVYVHC